MNPFGIKTEECNGNDWTSGCTYRLPALSGCTSMSTFEQLKQSVEKAKAVLNAEARETSRNYFSASFSALPGMGVPGMGMGVNFAGGGGAPLTNNNGNTNTTNNTNSNSSNGGGGANSSNSGGGGGGSSSSGGVQSSNNNSGTGTSNGSSSVSASAMRGVVEHALLVDLNHLTHHHHHHQHSPHSHHHSSQHHHQSHSLHQSHNGGGGGGLQSHVHPLSLSPDDRLGSLDTSTSPVSSSEHHHHSKHRSTSNNSSSGEYELPFVQFFFNMLYIIIYHSVKWKNACDVK